MSRTTRLGLSLACAALLLAGTAWGQAKTHLDHVRKSWQDTPGQVGLVTILEQEAKTALQHAQFATKDRNDFANIKMHTPHFRHAVKPEEVPNGPGKGYGVVKAARGVIAHMNFAMDASDASDSLKLHGQHVIQCAENIARWAEEVNTKGSFITGGASAVASAYYADESKELLGWILNGRDADGDGNITWQEGEGGLAQLKQHLGFIQQ